MRRQQAPSDGHCSLPVYRDCSHTHTHNTRANRFYFLFLKKYFTPNSRVSYTYTVHTVHVNENEWWCFHRTASNWIFREEKNVLPNLYIIIFFCSVNYLLHGNGVRWCTRAAIKIHVAYSMCRRMRHGDGNNHDANEWETERNPWKSAFIHGKLAHRQTGHETSDENDMKKILWNEWTKGRKDEHIPFFQSTATRSATRDEVDVWLKLTLIFFSVETHHQRGARGRQCSRSLTEYN